MKHPTGLIDAFITACITHQPPLPPSLYIPPPNDRMDDIPRGWGIDYGFVSTVDAKERRQGTRDVGYGIRDTWVDSAEAVPEIAPIPIVKRIVVSYNTAMSIWTPQRSITKGIGCLHETVWMVEEGGAILPDRLSSQLID
ncbi:hypothetical protein Tco_0241673 [Tanacetum coccineum]